MIKQIIAACACLLLLSGCAANADAGNVVTRTVAASDAVEGSRSAGYSTKFAAKDKGRTTNIKLASDAIDGTVIQPDEIFSFNDAVGPTTKNRGFKLAKIFVRGKDSKGYGGGVCQVSSTLYNAAEEFGLLITERHPHSKEVGYVPKNRDAATSYGKLDLKFKNSHSCPVKIMSGIENDTLTVEIVEV